MSTDGLSRRGLIAGAGTVGALALSGCLPVARGTAPRAAPATFLALAAAVTGGLPVEPALAADLYADLEAHHPGFAEAMPALTAALRAGTAAPHLPAAGAFADLLSGLYLGVTGPAAARRCIAFESIESYALVAGPIAPPSYALGAPGSWASPPPPLPHLPARAR